MSLLHRYFDMQIRQQTTAPAVARFRRNRITRSIQVFQHNCVAPCRWYGPGYGWGRWATVRPQS